MAATQHNTETLSSLYSLRSRAHNLLRLALDADDRATQDRYLAAAREVLEQMEDAFDTLELDTPEDAMTVLERLNGGDSDEQHGGSPVSNDDDEQETIEENGISEELDEEESPDRNDDNDDENDEEHENEERNRQRSTGHQGTAAILRSIATKLTDQNVTRRRGVLIRATESIQILITTTLSKRTLYKWRPSRQKVEEGWRYVVTKFSFIPAAATLWPI